ncbi:unnamed protein product [Gordionus sp. m RMFG-2023]
MEIPRSQRESLYKMSSISNSSDYNPTFLNEKRKHKSLFKNMREKKIKIQSYDEEIENIDSVDSWQSSSSTSLLNENKNHFLSNTCDVTTNTNESTELNEIDKKRTCVKNTKKDLPIQQCLFMLINILEKKDPNGFFAYPVNDLIAPGYSSIIQQPMDFSTIRNKIENNEYETIGLFHKDVKLMCNNALTYNSPDTIYHKAAKKLLAASYKYLAKDKFVGYRLNYSCIDKLNYSQLGFDLNALVSIKSGSNLTDETDFNDNIQGRLSGDDDSNAAFHEQKETDVSHIRQYDKDNMIERKRKQRLLKREGRLRNRRINQSHFNETGQNLTTSHPNFDQAEFVTTMIQDIDIMHAIGDQVIVEEREIVDEEHLCNDSELSPEQILADANKASEDARKKLEAINPYGKLGFLRTDHTGHTSLSFIPSGPYISDFDDNSLQNPFKENLKLTNLNGVPLMVGTDSVSKEDNMYLYGNHQKINAVQYLEKYGCLNSNYNPFSSYAPFWDSTDANITKEETDLLDSIYNSRIDDTSNEITTPATLDTSILSLDSEYALSLKTFSRLPSIQNYVDDLLDSLTQGAHGKNSQAINDILEKLEHSRNNAELDKESQKFYSDLPDELIEKFKLASKAIVDLNQAQKSRLSLPIKHLSLAPPPTDREINLASRARDNLVKLAMNAKPKDLVNAESIHNLIGLKTPIYTEIL